MKTIFNIQTIFYSLLIIAFLVSIYLNSPKCQKTSVIKMVGGCDRMGYCGVIYENGDEDVVKYPVMGQKITYSWICEEKK